MLPLRDNIRNRSFPAITILLILLNAYMFYQELLMDNVMLSKLINGFGLIPLRMVHVFQAVLPDYHAYLPLFSNLFLHGGWMHIIGNMWYLWVFGRGVEDCLGHLNYLMFYLFCGLAANLAQIAVDPGSKVAVIGASGAISGLLGAYLGCFPNARILTLIPLFLFFPIIEIPAAVFIGFWFFLQLQNGASAMIAASGNIAWWAHIGGFAAGFIFRKWFQ